MVRVFRYAQHSQRSLIEVEAHGPEWESHGWVNGTLSVIFNSFIRFISCPFGLQELIACHDSLTQRINHLKGKVQVQEHAKDSN
jgi:hypothetical protein